MNMNFDVYIEENSQVRLLNDVIDEIYFTKDYTVQSEWTGNIPEDIMMKILIFGYMNGAFSSRKIEQLCKRDIYFWWLLDGEYIVGIDVSNERSDVNTLIPFLEKLNSLELFVLQNIICDAGYESEENYLYLKSHDLTSYIKPVNYEQQKKKKKNYRTKYGRIENMEYHEMGDIFVCKAGRILWRVGTKHEKTKTGFISEKAVYRCESCEGCPYRQNCTKAKGDKMLAVSHRFRELRAESQENITTEFGTQLRMNRSIQAEGAFGVLKQDYGFRRFLCRGKNNIRTEFLLLGLAYNIKKFFAKVSGNRTGISLFELKTA